MLATGAGAAVHVGQLTFPAAIGVTPEGSEGAATAAADVGVEVGVEAGTSVGTAAPVGEPLMAEILERASCVLPPAQADPISLPAEARAIPRERPAAARLKPAALADCAADGMLA